MAVDRKRKTRTSRSRFGLWTSNKVIIIDGDAQSKPKIETSASSSDAAGGQNSEKDSLDGLKSRLRRNSTKLLSMLGFWNYVANKAANECPDPSESVDSSRSQSLEENLLPSDESSLCAAHSAQTPVDDDAFLRTTSINVSRFSNLDRERTDHPNLGSIHPSSDSSLQSGIRRSHTSPSLTSRLSQKLSAFGHPTVIHRTNVRSRPSIPNLDGSASFASLSKQPGDAQDSSDASTPHSGSDSPVSQSTNPTSSDVLSRSPKIPKLQSRSPGNRSWSFSLWTREVGAPASKLVPIREVPAIPSPSIITVEATATAKIFFETHFNSIFSGRDPRSQRLQELEDRLHGLPVSAEERLQARKAWLAQESEYLRQSRVLKTRSNSIRHLESVSIAGYEVIRVLGKGSFGVVRLVKEKKEGQDVCDGSIDKNTAPRSKPKDTPSLKASTAGSCSPRRSDVTKMKKEVFAMKVIRKSDMLRNCQEGHLRAERDFLVASEKSQWIIPLIASFQDTNYLYLVMDYMVGGDFLGLLIRKNILSEDVTRWYVAEMVLCVEEAHRLGWIHRDVKPDNFLISASGHLKISDFGLAFDGHWTHDQAYFNNQRHSLLQKLGIMVQGDSEDRKEAKEVDKQGRPLSGQVGLDCIQEPKAGERLLEWRNHRERRRLAKSIVGTSQYMAPEVIRGELYDGRCDWWSIGIILYECLYGFTPFACENRHATKIRILQHPRTLYFPVDKPSDKLVSIEAIDLISRILREKENRLCSRRYKVNDLLQFKKSAGELLNQPVDRASTDFKGLYVYPNDACDIKVHPFFEGIRWNELPFRKPPFIPKVNNWEDTRYFEEDEPISDMQDTSSLSNVPPPAPVPEPQDVSMVDVADLPPEAEVSRDAGKEQLISAPDNNQPANISDTPAKTPMKVHKRKKEKKRPRDKILRDEIVGKTVLDLRKKGAFLGYTYRRPRAVMLALETERGRSLVAW